MYTTLNVCLSGINFIFMDYDAILEKARTEGKFMFLRMTEFVVYEDFVHTSLDWIVTPIDCNTFGDCGGHGHNL